MDIALPEGASLSNESRGRTLADIVSLEAWHKSFGARRGKADLHVDVVFQEGRLGRLQDDDVRFRLSLRQAEVVVIIPSGEPATIDPYSVSRSTPTASAKSTREPAYHQSRRRQGEAKSKAGPSDISGGVELEASVEASARRETHIAITEQLKGMTLVHSQTTDGAHRWTVTPNLKQTLFGRPWDASKAPRLAVVDTRPDRSRGLEPGVRVEVRCLREDLVITDIVVKNRKSFALFKKKAFANNRAVAEAMIRTRLFEEGLMAGGDISDEFAQMTLAVTSAQSVT